MKRTRTRYRFITTPRLFVVGLMFFAACHRQASTTTQPAPATPEVRPARTTVTNAPSLVRAMRERYPNWFRTITFVQKTTVNPPRGGELVQTWYEAMSVPGRLRIDTDLSSRGGTLYARDSIFNFAAGKLVSADSGLNELLVLGFDVYAQSEARSEGQLRRLGFDLSRFHEGVWHGRPVYVVGAASGDTTSRQFWVDKGDLLFVRMLEPGRQGHTEVRFDKYLQVDGGWVATDVVQTVNGQRRLREEYSDVRVNVPLSEGLFDPKRWSLERHWTKATVPK